MSALSLRNISSVPLNSSAVPWNYDLQWDLLLNNYELTPTTAEVIAEQRTGSKVQQDDLSWLHAAGDKFKLCNTLILRHCSTLRSKSQFSDDYRLFGTQVHKALIVVSYDNITNV